MAAGTVAYTDTTGNKDYLGMIAGQIGRRLKDASDRRQMNVPLHHKRQKRVEHH